MLIEDHVNDQLLTDWSEIKDSEFEEVSELNNICFPEWHDLDFIRENSDTRGDIYRLYSYEHKRIIGYAVYGQVFKDNGAYILRIGTLPELRRQGIASWMLDCILIDLTARKKKCPAVYCDIKETNSSSMSLFIKSGFQVIQVRENFGENGETYNFMAKDIIN